MLTKHNIQHLTLIVSLFNLVILSAQEPNDTIPAADTTTLTEGSKFQQQPGLALAASKIFFSKKRYSISGFGEFNYIPIQSGVNTNLGDLELYYSGLYRCATFFGFRITDKFIWNSEVQIEFLHYKTQDTHLEFVFEAFFDYLFRDYLKTRIGFYPLTIGYINNNDEPIMFYSVNRPEVERLIIPSTWIELGAMFYGNIGKKWNYAFGVSQGLNSNNYLSGTWIRQGREIRFNAPKSISFNPQINYTGIKNMTLSVSGYFGNSGQNQSVVINEEDQTVKGNITLLSAYARYNWKNFRFITLGTYGQLGDSEKIYELTKNKNNGNGQVIGKEVYGYLFELGCDLLPYMRKTENRKNKKGFLYDFHEMKLCLFTRYERLNTHLSVHQTLNTLPRVENNLHIWAIGINFNTKENIVLKTNYQYRNNKFSAPAFSQQHFLETGLGFIF